MEEALRRAGVDLADGLTRPHLWGLLGLHDIKQRYRRSSLGPFWLTISMGIMIGAMGLLYARLFGQDVSEYLPYLAISLVLWTYISTLLNELCLAFISADYVIKQVKLPLTVHISRVIWRNLLILAHNAIIVVPIVIWCGKATIVGAISALIGVAFVSALFLWLGVILAVICARFRDIPQIVASLTQLVFFLSPVLWRPEVLGNRIWIAKANPIFHILEIVRAPLLGAPIPFASWLICLALFVLLAAIALPLLGAFGRRVPYWV